MVVTQENERWLERWSDRASHLCNFTSMKCRPVVGQAGMLDAQNLMVAPVKKTPTSSIGFDLRDSSVERLIMVRSAEDEI